jgi:hypothetical protein
LHVLSAPPAFVLSQDQTLREDLSPSEEGKPITLSLSSKVSRPFQVGCTGKAGPASYRHRERRLRA